MWTVPLKNKAELTVPLRKNKALWTVPLRKNIAELTVPLRKNKAELTVPLRKNKALWTVPLRKVIYGCRKIQLCLVKEHIAADVNSNCRDQTKPNQQFIFILPGRYILSSKQISRRGGGGGNGKRNPFLYFGYNLRPFIQVKKYEITSEKKTKRKMFGEKYRVKV